jgi:hypothetical protein
MRSCQCGDWLTGGEDGDDDAGASAALALAVEEEDVIFHRKKKLCHSSGIHTYGSGMAGRPFFPLYDLAMPEIHLF